MSKHTQGDWIKHHDEDSIGIYMKDADGTCGPQIAMVLTETLESADVGDLSQADADADLIVMAPKLLAAATDIILAARAVLDMLESEGRDTGMGGPLSDLRDQISYTHTLIYAGNE